MRVSVATFPRRLVGACMSLYLCASSATAGDAPGNAKHEIVIDGELTTFFRSHCYDCHGADVQEGKLRLDTLSGALQTSEAQETWSKILTRLAAGEMPPEDQPRPERAPLQNALSAIRAPLVAAVRSSVAGRPGRGPRRLNRAEYQNSVNALLGTDLDLAGYLPEDGIADGFDKVGRALNISSVQVERYLEASEEALDAVLYEQPKIPSTTRRYNIWDDCGIARRTFTYNGVFAESKDAVLAWYTSDKFYYVETFKAPVRGKYRIRISAYGTLLGKGAERSAAPVQLALHGGDFKSSNRVSHRVGFFSTDWEQPRVIEAVDLLEAGHSFKLTIAGRQTTNTKVAEYAGPALAVQWMEIEGPLDEGVAERRRQLVFDHVDPDRGTPADAERLLQRFAERAFRRPIDAPDVEPYAAVMRAQFAAGASFREGLKVGMQAVLCAPEFLFVNPEAADDYAVASRLSYFLWSAPPDAELLQAAASGKLRRADERRRHVDRMLADGRAQFFAHHFLDHWLDLKKIDFTTPDKDIYPEYDEPLRDAMVRETRMFFADLLQNDGSVRNIIDSDYAMLNARLARHYDISGVVGDDIRKVPLPADSLRGGLLTQASVLKVTADGTATSPVLRGVWLLDRILGRPVPPPPPGVPGVEPDVRGATTIREQLAKHRQSESCATCHKRIDPPGFALECFDAIGGFRDRYRVVDPERPGAEVDGVRKKYALGRKVETGDQMPDGRKFADVREFQRLLAADPRPVVENVAMKLLTYALGRELDIADREDVRQIVDGLKSRDFGLRSMIKELAASDAFIAP
ncbi:MAG: hypothetical protein C0483_17940 [Pirellula sp.]|nr:hypothetical protein [Pirellula sp.]